MFDRRILVGAASAFIESYNVTHYFTLTYPRRLGWEGRHKAFLKRLDAIEWMQRRPLGWFRADESRFSGLGFPEIPEHHHGLLVDTDHLCCKTAENLWRHFGDARVERYEPHGGAIPYCLKHAFRDSEWDLGDEIGWQQPKYFVTAGRHGAALKRGSTHDAGVPGSPSGPAKDPNRWKADRRSPTRSSFPGWTGRDSRKRETG